MSAAVEAFRAAYAAALRRHLELRSDASLETGHDLGRQALTDRVSILEITENHYRVIAGLDMPDGDAALQFLLQTLTALDIATRGFLDGTRRYEQQRVRADDLAEQDSFRRALVDSLQDGFFIADSAGTIVEVNGAFGEMTGYGPADVPYAWPHPWLPPDLRSVALPDFLRDRGGRAAVRIRHRDGRVVWLAISANSVPSPEGDQVLFVGTARDTTAEREAAQRERAAASLATALVAATTVSEVLSIGLSECRASTGADRAYAVVWPERGAEPLVYATGEQTSVEWDSLDERTRHILEHARHQTALTITSTAQQVEADSAAGLAATLGEGRDTALLLEFPARPPTLADRALLLLQVGHLGLALQRARNFDRARTTSLTLQRAMLAPLVLPPRFAVRYEPAEVPLEIGGDWYDVVPLLSRGRIGIIVGDCVGSGLSAAVVMGQLRSSCRALLLRGAGPGQLLDELDAFAARTPGAACTTVCAAILDPDTGILTYSNAGHMPAIVAGPGSVGDQLADARSLPLATFPCGPRPETTVVLAPGATLTLFTDGLVERRTASIDDGFDAVAGLLVDAGWKTADDVADLVLQGLAPEFGYDDDVAMVVYRQPPAPLHLDVPADPTQLAYIRRRLREWLVAASATQLIAADIVSAVNEASTNSIEHAYRGRDPERVVVTASAGSNEIVATVEDSGTWHEPAADPGNRGRGIAMMRALTDDVTLEHSAAGTVVTMRALLTAHGLARSGASRTVRTAEE